MSSAGETDDESRDSSEHPTVTTTAAGGGDRSRRDGERAAEAPSAGRSMPAASTTAPWQRATGGESGGGDQGERQGAGYGTYADDGYSSANERNAAQPPEQGAASSQGHPLVSGTTASRSGDEGATQTQGRSAIDLGAQPAAGGQADGAAQGRGPTPSALRRPGRGPRRASLQLKRFDPWSVLKLALVLCIAMFFVWMVAVGVLYGALDGMGVWDKINGTYNSLAAPQGSTSPLISAGSVFSVAAIIGAINIILFTALATIGAFVYNVSADLVGGLEVTLAERE